jgi:hypothetical protein
MAGTYVNISVEGIPAVMQKLSRFGAKTKQDLTNCVIKYAEQEQHDAKEYLRSTTPYPTVDTGDIIDNIEVQYSGTSMGIMRARVYTVSDHAIWVVRGRTAGARYPPPAPIKAWAARHGISQYFPISRAIAERGIKPKPFIEKPWSILRTRFRMECVDIVQRNSRYWRNI